MRSARAETVSKEKLPLETVASRWEPSVLSGEMTSYDAEVSVLVESEEAAACPLSGVAFVNWKKIKVKAGKIIEYRVKK